MKIRPIEVEVNSTKPFINCKLGREKYAYTLSSIINNYQDGFVLAINNEWGTGKTTFVKMWQQKLNLDGFKTLYFNAWENDFDSNPLVAIMSELNSLTNQNTKKEFKSILEKGAILSKTILPQLIKAIVEKHIDTKSIVELFENLTKGATEILEKEIKEYSQKKQGIKDFKTSLERFIKKSSDDKPIVIIIDELDRCRPNYAVELLEQIKHIFLVSGIVFVLSIDKTQLGHAVRGVYGSENINADEYLRRFIDVEYSIPAPNSKDFCNYLFDYFEFNTFCNSDKRKKYQVFNSDKESLIKVASALFEKVNMTLRQQEKVFAHARIALNFFADNQYIFPDLFIVLVFCKNFQNDFYTKMKLKLFDLQGLITEFENVILNEIDNNILRAFIYLEARLVVMYSNYLVEYNPISLINRDEKTGIESCTLISNLDKSENKHVFLESIKHLYYNHEFSSLSIEYLFNKIDFTDNISIN